MSLGLYKKDANNRLACALTNNRPKPKPLWAASVAFGCFFALAACNEPKNMADETNIAAQKMPNARDKIVEMTDEKPADFVFYDAQKKPVSVSDFKGKVVVLNLWATWCAPCIAELPTLNSLSKSLEGKNIIVIALSVDREEDRPKMLERLKTFGSLSAYSDPNFAAAKALNPAGMPTTYIFNKKGEIVAKVEGDADWHTPEIKDYVLALN